MKKENGYCLFYTARGLNAANMIPETKGRKGGQVLEDDATSADESEMGDDKRAGHCTVS